MKSRWTVCTLFLAWFSLEAVLSQNVTLISSGSENVTSVSGSVNSTTAPDIRTTIGGALVSNVSTSVANATEHVSSSPSGVTTVSSSPAGPTTASSSSEGPTTVASSSAGPTNSPSSSAGPTTVASSSEGPTTVASSSAGPTTVASLSEGPTTVASSSEGPTTVASSSAGPTTAPSSSAGPTTVASSSAGTTTVVTSFADNSRETTETATVDRSPVTRNSAANATESETRLNATTVVPHENLTTTEAALNSTTRDNAGTSVTDPITTEEPVYVITEEPDLFVNQSNYVTQIDAYFVENRKKHHTAEFADIDDELILRRGDSFKLRLTLESNYTEKDNIRVVLQTVSEWDRNHSLTVDLPLAYNANFNNDSTAFGLNILNVNGSYVDVEVYIPADAPVGRYNLTATPRHRRNQPVVSAIVLFNAWCPNDDAYVANETMREDYVLNDVGKMYLGSLDNLAQMKWIFGQYKSDVLKAVLFVLDKTGLNAEQRRNITTVAMMLSALVNVQDDDGVLVGNWGGYYYPYRAPTDWTGSAAILQEYYRTGGIPVRYGQCWVFGGVLTAVCRALGIAARPVTTVDSAHDTDGDLRIVKIYTTDMYEVPTSDSIWNFHVWTEAWMKRRDLQNPAYDGWQAIDATPQEKSEGIYKLGPASVNAIKAGDVLQPRDAPFVYAEVNADYYLVLVNATSRTIANIKVQTDRVGSLVITKALGPRNQDLTDPESNEDVTLNYKYPEFSDEERQSFYNATDALNVTRLRTPFGDEPPRNSFLRLFMSEADVERLNYARREGLVNISRIETSSTLVGSPLKVKISIDVLESQTVISREVDVSVSVQAHDYRGMNVVTITTLNSSVIAETNKSGIIEFTVSPIEYLDKLGTHSLVKVVVVANVQETNQVTAAIHQFKFDHPHLALSAEAILPVASNGAKQASLTIKFKNPMNIPLTLCTIAVESRAFGPYVLPVDEIGPNAEFSHTFKVPVSSVGQESFVANMNCKEVKKILGTFVMSESEFY